MKKGDHKLSITPKGRAAVEDMSLAPKGKGRKAAKALYKEGEIDEGPPTPKFKPLRHKVWSADASIPAGARPRRSW